MLYIFNTSIFKYCQLNDHDRIYKTLYEIPSTKLRQDLGGKNKQSVPSGREGGAQIALNQSSFERGAWTKYLGLLPEGCPSCKATSSSVKMQEFTSDRMQPSDRQALKTGVSSPSVRKAFGHLNKTS